MVSDFPTFDSQDASFPLLLSPSFPIFITLMEWL